MQPGFEINACPSVRDRLKSPRANCFHFSLAPRTGAVLCRCFVKNRLRHVVYVSLARRTGAITVVRLQTVCFSGKLRLLQAS